MLAILTRLRATLLKIEDWTLIGLLLMAIILAVLQIFLRNFFDSGIIWADSFLKIAVLWIGMFGAMYASRNDEHINIEIGIKHLSNKIKPYVQAIVFLFTASVCAIVAWYSVGFVFLEYQDNAMAFAKVPVWITEAIIPFAFIVIALRYLISTILLFVPSSSLDTDSKVL